MSWIIDLRKELGIPNQLSEVIKEKDFNIDLLSEMALNDPSTITNPKNSH